MYDDLNESLLFILFGTRSPFWQLSADSDALQLEGVKGTANMVVALAAGLPDAVSALTLDRQCCSGLDAVVMAARSIAAGEAGVIVAGGIESFSRAPIRMHRPLEKGGEAVAYDRPAFVADPSRDPDPLQAAARLAVEQGCVELGGSVHL